MNIIKFILVTMGILTAASCSQNAAQSIADSEFKNFLKESKISESLFEGPAYIGKIAHEHVFHWISKVPRRGDTIIEIRVSLMGGASLYIKGPREDMLYLTMTDKYALSEAMLIHLFSTPKYRNDADDHQKQIQSTTLTSARQVDIANFVHIKRDLLEYYLGFRNEYPDSLEHFNHFDSYFSGVFKLDSLFLHDQYGHKYFYTYRGKFVILGSPGKNEVWDFDQVLLDSIFNDQIDHIYTKDDDIIVKFRPVYR